MKQQPPSMASLPSGSRVVTFYSYKGGTGRTMALANTAWILASQGKKVLTVDWDLEAPGLHRYFAPFLPDPGLRQSKGLIDLLLRYMVAATKPAPRNSFPGGSWYSRYADLSLTAEPLTWRFPNSGRIDLLGAGEQSALYANRVNRFDWNGFYETFGGSAFLDEAFSQARGVYDFVLIDSRTGVSDTSGICTVQLPDSLVVCFTLNTQSIEGAFGVAADVVRQRRAHDGGRGFRIFPLATRIDLSEKPKLHACRTTARARFRRFIGHIGRHEREDYFSQMEVLYDSYYAYEEELATIADQPGNKNSVLSTFERLTAYLTDGEVTQLAPVSEAVREEARQRSGLGSGRVGGFPSSRSKARIEARTDVFIATSDNPRVRDAAKRLREQLEPYCTVFDPHVSQELGQNLTAEVNRAVEQASVIVPLLSKDDLISAAPLQGGLLDVILEKAPESSAAVIPVTLGAGLGELPSGLRSYRGVELQKAGRDLDRVATAVLKSLGIPVKPEVPLDEEPLVSRHRAAILAATVALLFVLVAWHQRGRAVEQSEKANSEATFLYASLYASALADAADQESRSDSELGLLLAIAAAETAIGVDAEAPGTILRKVHETLAAAYSSHSTHSTPAVLREEQGAVFEVTFAESRGQTLLGAAGADGRLLSWRKFSDATYVSAGLWDTKDHQPDKSDGQLWCVAYSKDGRYLAVGGDFEAVLIWDQFAETEPPRVVWDQGRKANGLSFHPSGDFLAVAYEDRKVTIWDLGKLYQADLGVHQELEKHEDRVFWVSYSPDGSHLATASVDGTAIIWDAQTWKPLRTLSHSDRVYSVKFSPDGRSVATGSSDNLAKVWDVETGRELLRLRADDDVRSVAYSPDGRLLATGSADGRVRIWTTSEGRELGTNAWRHEDAVWSVAFSPDGHELASSSADGTVALWENHFTEELHERPVSDLDLDAASQNLVTIDEAGEILLWTLANSQFKRVTSYRHEGGEGWHAVALSAFGEIASGGPNGTVRLHNLVTGEETPAMQFENDAVLALAFAPPPERLLAASSRSGEVRIFDMAKGAGAAVLPEDAKLPREAFALDFSTTGLLAAFGYAPEGLVWDLSEPSESPVRFGNTEGRTFGVAFSPTDQTLATSGGGGGRVQFWDAGGNHLGESSPTVPLITDVSYAPGERAGASLATASIDGRVRLWSLREHSATEVLSFAVHDEAASAVAFTPAGERVVSAGLDGSVVVTWLDLNELIQRASELVRRGFTNEECDTYWMLREAAISMPCPEKDHDASE